VTLTPGAAVTVSSLATTLAMSQFQVATLIKTATNTWVANLGGGGGGGAGDSDQTVLAVQIFS
jgi:hypothetical protein